MIIKKTQFEKFEMNEQNKIKKYLECVAVYDMPKDHTYQLCVHDYGTEKQGHRLYIYKDRIDTK